MPDGKDKPDLGGVKLVMNEYADKITGEKADKILTKEEIIDLNIKETPYKSKMFPNGGESLEAIKEYRYHELMKVADLNKDGNLDGQEFARLAMALRENDPKLYKEFAKDGEFTVTDAIKMSSNSHITIDDVKKQNIDGIEVTSKGKER